MNDIVFPSLKGRVAVVTGAGQGIGRVFAKAFARSGAIPVIAGRNMKNAEGVAREIAEPDSVRRMVAAVDERYGVSTFW